MNLDKIIFIKGLFYNNLILNFNNCLKNFMKKNFNRNKN